MTRGKYFYLANTLQEIWKIIKKSTRGKKERHEELKKMVQENIQRKGERESWSNTLCYGIREEWNRRKEKERKKDVR